MLYKTDWPVVQQKDLAPGTALVKIVYSGVCHTDLHALHGDWPAHAKLPLVGGHEGSGYVVAFGNNSPDTDLKIGDAVGVKWLADSCLACDNCRGGYESICGKAQNAGFTIDGSFQQYAVAFTKHLTPIPEGLSLEQAAPILCAGVTVWKAIKTAAAKPGDFILISGAGGGLGHLAVQYAAALSLRVIALDTGADKKALTLKLGAESFVDFKDKDAQAQIIAASGGLGPHAAIVASGSAAAYEQALDYLRPTGTLVFVGLPPDCFVKVNVFWTVMKSLTIKGSLVGNRQDAIESLDLAARGKAKAIIAVEPLKNLESVYERLQTGKIAGRIVLDTWA